MKQRIIVLYERVTGDECGEDRLEPSFLCIYPLKLELLRYEIGRI